MHGELTRKLRIHDQFPFPLNFRESREDAVDQKLSTRSNNFNILYVRARVVFRETFGTVLNDDELELFLSEESS